MLNSSHTSKLNVGFEFYAYSHSKSRCKSLQIEKAIIECKQFARSWCGLELSLRRRSPGIQQKLGL